MSASRSLLLLVLVGCNQLFGIKDTAPEPPTFYDGGIDAARGCPAHDATPDSYSPFVHEAYKQDCHDFSSVPAGRASAICYHPAPTIHEGVDGQPLPSAGIVVAGVSSIRTPRLSPDGQRLLAVMHAVAEPNVVHMYVRQSDGSWLESPITSFAATDPLMLLSTIGHAPTGDRVLAYGDGVTEWELQGATWRPILVQATLVPGETQWSSASMTSDALRLMVTKGDQVYYSDRPDTTQLFGPLVPIAGVPSLDDLFMTDDCARVYMSGFGGLYYVQQD
jgi:hypothetical protein